MRHLVFRLSGSKSRTSGKFKPQAAVNGGGVHDGANQFGLFRLDFFLNAIFFAPLVSSIW